MKKEINKRISMRTILCFGFLMFQLIAYTQTKQPTIELSENLEAFKAGVWINGDYTIYVDRYILATNFRLEAQNATKSIAYYGDKDTNLVNYFIGNAKRYQQVADQLENGSEQLDLRLLILYNGLEDSRQNHGSSPIVENALKEFINKGNAIVYYKGKRIYTLQRTSKLINSDDILSHGYEHRTFVDNSENCLFIETVILGW